MEKMKSVILEKDSFKCGKNFKSNSFSWLYRGIKNQMMSKKAMIFQSNTFFKNNLVGWDLVKETIL